MHGTFHFVTIEIVGSAKNNGGSSAGFRSKNKLGLDIAVNEIVMYYFLMIISSSSQILSWITSAASPTMLLSKVSSPLKNNNKFL